MKRTICLLMAVLMLLSLTVTALADGTTSLFTTVPPATYTLNIPPDVRITYGATVDNSPISNLPGVSNASGFASGKSLAVTITYTPFQCDTVSTTIPYTLYASYKTYDGNYYKDKIAVPSGSELLFYGQPSGTVSAPYLYDPQRSDSVIMTALYVNVLSTDWGKALAGDYTATITFTSEVVSK